VAVVGTAIDVLLGSDEPGIVAQTKRDLLGEERCFPDGTWRPGGKGWKAPGSAGTLHALRAAGRDR
jgi:hypothetical protein